MEENQKMKPVQAKSKEKRLHPIQPESQPKKSIKPLDLLKNMKNDVIQPSTSLDNSLPANKILKEANKIIKFALEKEFALQEKESNLQNTCETIENLRKNIIHLQMEYEKLDQNYQKELLHRSEIVKRMEETRNIVESAITYSNTLSASVKQVEADKLKIAEFYELIHQGQKEVEEKHSNLKKLIEERDMSLKNKIDEMNKANEKTLQQNSEVINSLNRKLSYANDKLQIAVNENNELQSKMQEIKESNEKQKLIQEKEERIKKFQEDKIANLSSLVKSLKMKKLKTVTIIRRKQKELGKVKNKFRRACSDNVKSNEFCKELLDKISTLEAQSCGLENKIKELKEEKSSQEVKWNIEKFELLDTIRLKQTEYETLLKSNETLQTKISEKEINHKVKLQDMENLQKEMTKLKEENEKLKQTTKNLNSENEKKNEVIGKLESKVKACGDDMYSRSLLFENEAEQYKLKIKSLEDKLLEGEKNKLAEINKKEEIISELKNNLSKSAREDDEKIKKFQKLLEERSKTIDDLQLELKDKETSLQTLKHEILNNSFENQKSVVKLKEEIELQKYENKLLNSKLKAVQETKENLLQEVENTKSKIEQLDNKLNEEKLSVKSLKLGKNEMEKTVKNLREEIQLEKKLHDNLKEKYAKAEGELLRTQSIETQNSELKAQVSEIRKLLEEAEAKVEAYKVVTKKLETEKNIQEEENTKLKMNRNCTEPQNKENKSIAGTPTKNIGNNNTAANEENIFQGPLTPIGNTKKFLQTPRKIFSSTPQPGHRSLTTFKKKRDPYEFDSDSSIEHFDPDQVLRVFNNRQKKESAKKLKNTK